jgi:glyoxylase-like metal-dependent hydrolase (beta-lactamase superfamily II)
LTNSLEYELGVIIIKARFSGEEGRMKKARLSEAATADMVRELVNPAKGVWMIPGFGNTGVLETEKGLVLIDVPGIGWIDSMLKMVRENLPGPPVNTIFLTHGHLDHALSLSPVLEEARRNEYPRPRIIAQRNLVARFNRYRMLHGYQHHINRIQFAVPKDVSAFPLPKINPDITFDQRISICVEGIDFHAFHATGETGEKLNRDPVGS